MTYRELLHRSMTVRHAHTALRTARYWREQGNRHEAAHWLSYAASVRVTLY